MNKSYCPQCGKLNNHGFRLWGFIYCSNCDVKYHPNKKPKYNYGDSITVKDCYDQIYEVKYLRFIKEKGVHVGCIGNMVYGFRGIDIIKPKQDQT